MGFPDIHRVVAHRVGKAQIAPHQLAAGDDAAGDDVRDAEHGHFPVLGVKAGFHGCGQISVVIDVDRHVVALVQQGFDVNVVPAQLGDEADHPV